MVKSCSYRNNTYQIHAYLLKKNLDNSDPIPISIVVDFRHACDDFLSLCFILYD